VGRSMVRFALLLISQLISPAMAGITHIDYVRPKLTDYQIAALFCKERIAIVEASTKSGKTVGALAWLTEQAFTTGAPGKQFWWIAPSFSQAKIAYGRCKRGLMPLEVRHTNDSDLTVTLLNGAVMSFKSGEIPDNLYGENVYAAVIDEMTRLREDAWFALRSTLTKTQGPVRMIGNLKGRGNWAYKLARKAEAGEPDMHYAMINSAMAVKAGVLHAEEIEAAKRILPERIFNELYLCIPSDDGGNPFGLQHIKNCVSALSTKSARVFGVDLAKSVDWTVVIGLDQNGYISKWERWQSPWAETKEHIKALVGNTKTLVDSTGVGDPVLEDLQRARGGVFEGYHFTPASKQKLMEGLAVAIQQQKVHFPDGVIRNELDSFEYEYTGRGGISTGVRYSAPDNMHDDCVMALALAVEHAPKATSMWDRL
jgi:Terminase large subunit, T4likevirus-type, N-terminal